MRKMVLIVISLLIIIAAVLWWQFGQVSPGKIASPNMGKSSGSTVPSATPLSEVEQNKADYYFPLSDYFSRIKVKKFGQLVRKSDKFDIPCGRPFSGLHDGDDLEVTEAEQNQDVVVHAVAAGKVVSLGKVSGYGGLLAQSTNLGGDEVTVYYGHINTASAKVGVDEQVASGQELANLGKGCSAETDGERKHLHFAIRKGSGVDVRGYAPSASVLGDWINPGETLKQLGAVSP